VAGVGPRGRLQNSNLTGLRMNRERKPWTLKVTDGGYREIRRGKFASRRICPRTFNAVRRPGGRPQLTRQASKLDSPPKNTELFVAKQNDGRARLPLQSWVARPATNGRCTIGAVSCPHSGVGRCEILKAVDVVPSAVRRYAGHGVVTLPIGCAESES